MGDVGSIEAKYWTTAEIKSAAADMIALAGILSDRSHDCPYRIEQIESRAHDVLAAVAKHRRHVGRSVTIDEFHADAPSEAAE